MSLSRRAPKPGNRVLLIDDFMKAGYFKGLTDLMVSLAALWWEGCTDRDELA